jgi:hypothetical protein
MLKPTRSKGRERLWGATWASMRRAGLVALLTCACSPGNQEVSVESTLSAPVLLCDEANREFYVREAITRKLDHYPELADYAGLKEVENCEDARAFRTAYYEFSALHPNFDRDQPAGAIPDIAELGAPELGEDPEVEVSKIRGGTNLGITFPISPFVRIADLREGGTCTATFIAKHWLLTAAHCLSLADLTVPIPPDDRRHRHLVGYGRYRIEWANDAGDIEPMGVKITARGLDMLQLPHPNFMGSAFPDDIALIYLNNAAYDRMLPGRVDQGAAMRLSVRPVQFNPVAGQPVANPEERVFAAGYGDPVDTRLRAASVFPSQLPSIRGARTFGAVLANFPPPEGTPLPSPPGTQPALCEGDSGGPVWRENDVEGGPNKARIMVGSFIGWVGADTCGPPLGSTQIWTDISEYTKRSGIGICGTDPTRAGCFIEAHIARWVGKNFKCELGSRRGHPDDDDFIQCWTQPCEAETCGADNFCAHTVRATSCPACGDGTCTCVFGQCEPKKR